MEAVYIPLISALAGALIGSMSTVLTILIQGHYQTKREINGHGIQIAFQDYKNMLENAKPGTRVYPISLFINYHMKMIRLASKGKLTPQELEKLDTELKTLMDKVTELNQPKTPKS